MKMLSMQITAVAIAQSVSVASSSKSMAVTVAAVPVPSSVSNTVPVPGSVSSTVAVAEVLMSVAIAETVVAVAVTVGGRRVAVGLVVGAAAVLAVRLVHGVGWSVCLVDVGVGRCHGRYSFDYGRRVVRCAVVVQVVCAVRTVAVAGAVAVALSVPVATVWVQAGVVGAHSRHGAQEHYLSERERAKRKGITQNIYSTKICL